MTERVILVLGEERVEASREDLISKSEYFASLFSPNFRDSLSNEHRINYDIDVKTLRAYVGWSSDRVTFGFVDRRRVKPSLANYVGKSADFDNLSQLLQLSVIFASEALVNDLTDLIACHWLIPEKSVQIWLLARDLGLSTLRDLAKVMCIDRLCDLPESSLLELSGEDFIDLVGNFGVQVDEKFLPNLAKRWCEHNVAPGDTNAFESRYPFTMIGKWISSWDLKRMYAQQWNGKNIQCIVGRKNTEDNKETLCVYCWDGTTFSEIIELPSFSTVSTATIVGMQAVGRGFDIYLVGGEYGENTGHFQTGIWRYSMISKTWYYVTSMPRPQRHMAVAFVKEKLFLIGGLVNIRRERSTVDIYNIHEEKWSKAPSVYEEFTNMSLIYQDGSHLTLYDNRRVAGYMLDENKWESYCGDFIGVLNDDTGDLLDTENITAQFLWDFDGHLYVLDFDDVRPPKIWTVEDFEHFESELVGSCHTSFDNQVASEPYLIGFSHEDGTMCIEMVKITRYDTMETKIVYKEKRSDIRDLCSEDPIGCFNISNPSSLNELFVLKPDAKYELLV